MALGMAPHKPRITTLTSLTNFKARLPEQPQNGTAEEELSGVWLFLALLPS